MPGHQCSKLPTLAETLSVVHAIAQTVTSTKYAICGGGACVVLGSARQTEDVDFVVPRGDTKKARSDLRSSQSFTVQPRTNHTAFVGPNRDVEPIDIERQRSHASQRCAGTQPVYHPGVQGGRHLLSLNRSEEEDRRGRHYIPCELLGQQQITDQRRSSWTKRGFHCRLPSAIPERRGDF